MLEWWWMNTSSGDILVDVGLSTGSLNTLLLSLGQLDDVAVGGVL